MSGVGWDSKITDRAARTAAIHCHPTFLSPDERYEIAWSAIAIEHITNADATLHQLGSIGMDAITNETRQYRRNLGLNDNARAFNTYWLDRSWSQHDVASVVVNPIALQEVLADISELHRNDLMIYAAIGSVAPFAEVMGLSVRGAHRRIREARTAFYRKWFDWERAPRPVQDRRLETPLPDVCSKGHQYTPENTGWRKSTSGRGRKRRCLACDAEYKKRIRAA